MSRDRHSDLEKQSMFLRGAGAIVTDHYLSDEGAIFLTSSVAALDKLWTKGIADPIGKLIYIPAAADRFREKGFKDYFVDQERDWIKNGIKSDLIKSAEEMTLRSISASQAIKEIRSSSAVLVGGGNVQYLMELLRKTEVDKAITGKVDDNTLRYLGRCAGAIIAGPSLDPRGTFWPSLAQSPFEDLRGLSLTNTFPFPHVDSVSIMNRTHAINRRSGWQMAVEMAHHHPTLYLTDAIRESM